MQHKVDSQESAYESVKKLIEENVHKQYEDGLAHLESALSLIEGNVLALSRMEPYSEDWTRAMRSFERHFKQVETCLVDLSIPLNKLPNGRATPRELGEFEFDSVVTTGRKVQGISGTDWTLLHEARDQAEATRVARRVGRALRLS